ncbi:MAG: hypothetical protein EO766_17515 [Hydrotalea sp. AMD]|uniref:hypothetical protein n=1 Tax=Hydrotalea sp. AMD TaxID=2501297 RepID=UPI0010267027|nr:hypothetical protein [Hydrotalea sp. AMD]RWZ83860.1 MAG: hypothetical protein EO766_17515 [Hydrotalea sp. AMD]
MKLNIEKFMIEKISDSQKLATLGLFSLGFAVGYYFGKYSTDHTLEEKRLALEEKKIAVEVSKAYRETAKLFSDTDELTKIDRHIALDNSLKVLRAQSDSDKNNSCTLF